ncbi:MAG TPA: cysteine desulfurase family protein [Candidatus Eisenbacteria bacterium]|nr:cysteine desulfurase family protein [Candidatus Eisenbacteria bacterium]
MEAYLDYNATSPLDPRVFEFMKTYLTGAFGNASSIHKKGQEARNAVEAAREKIADALEVEPGDVFFTSGGTESDNLALKGMMEASEKRKHLVVSAVEHQAVLFPAQYLEKRGYYLTVVRAGSDGVVDLNALKEAINDDTALVSLMHVNNETGAIQPVEEAARLAHAKGALLHVDAVQSFGKLPVQPEEAGFDLVSLSGHKICGPKGAGALYVKKGVKLKALTHGGHQEKNVRPGTENVAAIAGFGRAAELAAAEREEDGARAGRLRDRLEEGLRRAVPGLRLNGPPAGRVRNTLNLSFEGLEGETLLMNFDLKGICVSTGSACTAGSIEPSHVLLAMGLSEPLARDAVRFSLGRFTTGEEIDYALAEIPAVVERLRKASVSRKSPPPAHSKLP